eukprot:m.123642 g.123642  ORF g.123642 m.123642 type:complete len:486 (-) comp22022_c0_seq6:145-1602(-)
MSRRRNIRFRSKTHFSGARECIIRQCVSGVCVDWCARCTQCSSVDRFNMRPHPWNTKAQWRFYCGVVLLAVCFGNRGVAASQPDGSDPSAPAGSSSKDERDILLDETSELVHKLENLGKAPYANPADPIGEHSNGVIRPALNVQHELDVLELRVAQLLQVASGETAPDFDFTSSVPCTPQPATAAAATTATTGPATTEGNDEGNAAGTANETAEAGAEDDVEGEIVKQCEIGRFGLRTGLLAVVLLLVGAPIFYVIYNRRSIIDGVVDSEFATLDVDNSNSIDANEFYIAVLQMYLKVNRITTILPPKYLEIRRYFDENHEMDRKEFKAAVAILIDTTLKRVLASLVLTFCTPWIAPHIVDIAAFALNPLIYAADMSTCGHAVVVVIGTLINRQLFTTITSVLLVLIALPRMFMWIDKEEQQMLDGKTDVSILGRIKTFLKSPKLLQARMVELKKNVNSVSQRSYKSYQRRGDPRVSKGVDKTVE